MCSTLMSTALITINNILIWVHLAETGLDGLKYLTEQRLCLPSALERLPRRTFACT